MNELKAKLLIAVTEASVQKNGVDIASNAIHADAIISLVDAIIAKVEK